MKKMNHSEYMKKVKSLDDNQLRYIIKDCQEAMDALPDNPNNSFYQDEIHYCAMELSRRAMEKPAKNTKIRIFYIHGLTTYLDEKSIKWRPLDYDGAIEILFNREMSHADTFLFAIQFEEWREVWLHE